MKEGADLTTLRGSLPALLFFQGFAPPLVESFDFTRLETLVEVERADIWVWQTILNVVYDLVKVGFGMKRVVSASVGIWFCRERVVEKKGMEFDFVSFGSKIGARASSVLSL